MRDRGVGGEQRVDARRIGRRILGSLVGCEFTSHGAAHAHHAVAVGAIDDDQQLTATRHEGA